MPLLSKNSKQEFHSPVERLLASIASLQEEVTSKGTHFYRTSLRRFQAWSDVFHPQVGPEQQEAFEVLDRLRKRTGKLRDSEIHLDIVKSLKKVDAKEKKKLTGELKWRRKHYLKKLSEQLEDPALPKLWQTLWLLREQPPRTQETANTQSSELMTTLALKEFGDFVQKRPKLSPENLHEYRLQAKRFRYTAEMAGEAATAKNLVETWQRVQDAIGDWHDYLTLTELAADILGDSSVHSSLLEQTNRKYAEAEQVVVESERKMLSDQGVSRRKSPQPAGVGRRASRIA